jgi:peptide/nickel transport system substrate-binding protein
MRRYYWYFTAYARKHGWIVLTSLIVAITIFTFFVPFLSKILARKPREYIGIVGQYSLTSLPPQVKNTLSVGLTKLEADGSVKPLLAERWIVEDEGKRYRFILRKKLKWQDGKDVEPGDIKYNFTDVETLTTPNDVIFKLPEVFVPFPSIVVEPVFRQVTERYWGFFERPTLIGIGENRIVDYEVKGNWLKEITIDGPENRQIFRFYLTEDDAVLAFKRGEVDVLPDLSTERDIATWKTTTVKKKLQTDQYLAVFFNTSDQVLPKNVRQALSYALSLADDDERATGPINPKSWAYLPGGKVYNYDGARGVERLLDGIPNVPINLELTTTASFTPEAETFQRAWEALGQQAFETCQQKKTAKDKTAENWVCDNVKIKVTLKITNFPDTNNFQLLLMGQQSPPDPDQYFLWHSSQPTNFTHYKNTRIDSLLEKGRQTLDQAERVTIYQEFQQFLQEDPPAIFLRHLNTYEVRRK